MNNRQSGRRRGRNNNQRQQGPGRNHDQGNRIDSRARGNAAQLLEKYRNMARDAQLSGDRVMMEYYLQFADHYFRVLSDSRSRQEEARARSEDPDGDANHRDDNDDDRAEGQDGDELDAIDTIGRAPRNRGGREDRGPREDRNGRDGREERAGREPREGRNRRDGGRPRREDGHGRDADDGDAPSGIDVAILPPAIGADTASREEGEAPAEPKRRPRLRKAAAAEADAAE